jgi:hypothetical protein
LEHGQYAFVLAPACDRGAVGYILCDTRNGYPDGIYWITHRGGDCVPSPVAGGGDNDDLCFRAEFCGAETTPVMRKSWGAVKAIYR